jgi:hypothetical protein
LEPSLNRLQKEFGFMFAVRIAREIELVVVLLVAVVLVLVGALVVVKRGTERRCAILEIGLGRTSAFWAFACTGKSIHAGEG